MATIKLVKGEDRLINFTLKETNEDGVTTYLDLTGATEIELRMAHETSGYVSFKLSDSEVAIVDAIGGVFSVSMGDVKTATMKVFEDQNIEVIVDIGAPSAGDRRIVQLLQVLTVSERLFA